MYDPLFFLNLHRIKGLPRALLSMSGLKLQPVEGSETAEVAHLA
jgi:hypothetical protein